MRNQPFAIQERTLRLAHEFVREARLDLEKAAANGEDLPPRIRTVHDRTGHASPEFRTLAVPIPAAAEGASPEVLSGAIARFAEKSSPQCLLLVLDVVGTDENGEPTALFVAEARDRNGTRFFLMQPFQVENRRLVWQEPLNGGWQEPGEDEMILDAAFR